jgi:hypothetical protein
MNLQTRIDRAEVEAAAHLKANQDATVSDWVTWIRTGSEAERWAYWRWLYAMGHFSNEFSRNQLLDLMGGRIEVTPEDKALAEAFDAQMPPDLSGRLDAACEAIQKGLLR